jgi:GTPase SAR1 family protein
LVYDITERASLENIKKVWLPDIREKGHEDVTIALLGNKADIGDNLA